MVVYLYTCNLNCTPKHGPGADKGGVAHPGRSSSLGAIIPVWLKIETHSMIYRAYIQILGHKIYAYI
jgi:hypothetical protein